MQRRHYLLIAQILRNMLEQSAKVDLDRAQYDWIVDQFSHRLKIENSAFDASKFREACEP